MMEENVVSSAGTTFRLNASDIERLIRGRLRASPPDFRYQLLN
jgi:hypothetical protein